MGWHRGKRQSRKRRIDGVLCRHMIWRARAGPILSIPILSKYTSDIIDSILDGSLALKDTVKHAYTDLTIPLHDKINTPRKHTQQWHKDSRFSKDVDSDTGARTSLRIPKGQPSGSGI